MIRIAQEAHFRAASLIAQSRELAARARRTGKLAYGAPEAQRLVERERAVSEAALAAEHASLALAELDRVRREAEDRAWLRAEVLAMFADGWTRDELREVGFTDDFLRWVGVSADG